MMARRSSQKFKTFEVMVENMVSLQDQCTSLLAKKPTLYGNSTTP